MLRQRSIKTTITTYSYSNSTTTIQMAYQLKTTQYSNLSRFIVISISLNIIPISQYYTLHIISKIALWSLSLLSFLTWIRSPVLWSISFYLSRRARSSLIEARAAAVYLNLSALVFNTRLHVRKVINTMAGSSFFPLSVLSFYRPKTVASAQLPQLPNTPTQIAPWTTPLQAPQTAGLSIALLVISH